MAVAGFLLVPNTPVLQSIVPISETALLLVPAIGVCAALGWAVGGRPWLVVVWSALAAAVIFWNGFPHTTVLAMESGWALVLVSSFGLVCAASPSTTSFLSRALTALAATVALVGLLSLGTRDAATVSEHIIRADVDARPNAALDWVRRTASTPEWHDWTTAPQGVPLDAAEHALDGVLATLPNDAVALYPALLGLESLIALALAWSLFHRISRVRIGASLGRLVDFRFSDQLVWGVIAGATLVALQAPGPWRALGFNLLLFFGVLFALRGLAVLAWYLEAWHVGAPAIAALALLAALLSAPSSIALGLIGLTDSWLDWRRRPRSATPRLME